MSPQPQLNDGIGCTFPASRGPNPNSQKAGLGSENTQPALCVTTSHTHSDPVSVALLLAEVQQLKHDVRQLLDRMPNPSKTWLKPKEFAAYADVSTRTLRAWRAEGRFREQSIRQTSGGWQFHAERAATDLRGF